jgi:hypothetical protein
MLTPVQGSDVGTWRVGDTIVGPFVVQYSEDGVDPVDLNAAGWSVTSGQLIAPDGLRVIDTVPGKDADGAAVFVLPGDEAFDQAGLWRLVAAFALNSNRFTADALPFPVESDAWLTLAGVRSVWRDAPASDVQLWRLLDVARQQVTEWAPQPIPDPVPDNLTTAQFTQARNVWNAIKADPSNLAIGDDALLIRPFPLDWTVKRMIRPANPRPVVR